MLHIKKCIITATVICGMLCTMHMLHCLRYAELELMHGIVSKKSRNIYQRRPGKSCYWFTILKCTFPKNTLEAEFMLQAPATL
jgi:hypothetical protein